MEEGGRSGQGTTVVRRPANRKATRPVSLDDVRFAATAPFFALAPALLSPRMESGLLGLGMRLLPQGRRHGQLAGTIARTLEVAPCDAEAIVRQSRTWRAERKAQIFRTLSRQGWHPQVRIDGAQHIADALAARRGAVLWVSHFVFSSLVTKLALARAGCAFWHVSRPEHGFSKSHFGMRYLNPIRVAAENRFLAGRIVIRSENPGRALLEASRKLKANGLVSITAGAWEGTEIVRGNLLGGRMTLAAGAPNLSHLAKAPLLPVFTVFDQAHDAYTVRVNAPLTLDPSQERETAIGAATQAFLAQHEPWIRTYPAQWDGWKYLEKAEGVCEP